MAIIPVGQLPEESTSSNIIPIEDLPKEPSIAERTVSNTMKMAPDIASNLISPLSYLTVMGQKIRSQATENLLNTEVMKKARAFAPDTNIDVNVGPIKFQTPFTQRDVAKEGQRLAVDITGDVLTGAGISGAVLGKKFLSTKPFASSEALMDDMFDISNRIARKTVQAIGTRKTTQEGLRETANIIGNTKNPIEAKIKLEGLKTQLFNERDKLLVNHNRVLEPTHVKVLEDFKNTEDYGIKLTETQRTGFEKVVQEAKLELQNIGKKFDLLQAQKLKSKYQDLARYERNPDALLQGQAIAARKLSTTLENMIVSDLPTKVAEKVRTINSRYSGFLDGIDLFTKLQQDFISDPNKFKSGLQSYIANTVRPTRGSAVAAAIRELPKLFGHGSYKSYTKKVGKLSDEYSAIKTILENRAAKATTDQQRIGTALQALKQDPGTGFTMPNQQSGISPAQTPPDIGSLEYGQRSLPQGSNVQQRMVGSKPEPLSLPQPERGFTMKEKPLPEELQRRIKDTFARSKKESVPVRKGKQKIKYEPIKER